MSVFIMHVSSTGYPAISPSLPVLNNSFQVTFCHIRQEVGAEGDVKVSSFPGIRDPLGFQE